MQASDRELLEKLNISIENERPVKNYITGKGYNNSKLYFYSKQIKADLAKYRIIPNKTYNKNYGFPFILKPDFYMDYIRGLFDGDGSIKMTGNSPTFQIDTGSKEIAEKICSIFNKYNITLSITEMPKVNVIIYRVYGYGKNKLTKIYNLIYKTPSNLFLARKKAKFKSLINIS